MVDLIDTNGVKPTLKKGVLGYDDYNAGGDAGRLYVGTGTASIAQAKKSEVDSHTSNVSNPHSVTKTQVGLGNVDNTSDVNKPVSTATQTALNTKVDKVTSTDNAIARFDGTTGNVQNSGVIVDDSNNVGIGTGSNINAKLDVQGSIRQYNPGTTANSVINYVNDSKNWYVGLRGDSSNAYSIADETRQRLLLDTTGNTLHLSPLGGLGYGTGAGGTVTQLTSKSTTVTLNKPCGSIIMNNASLAAGAYVNFTLNNSILSSTDGIIITQNDTGAYVGSNYDIKVVYKTNGSAIIFVKNISASTLSDAVTFRFDIIKGATA